MATIYFIQAGGEGGYIKIGITTRSPRIRMAALQSACPLPLKHLHDVPGEREDELAMHMRFAHLHYLGEWFRPGEDLLAFCGALPKKAKPPKAEKRPPFVPTHTEAEIWEDFEKFILEEYAREPNDEMYRAAPRRFKKMRDDNIARLIVKHGMPQAGTPG